MGLDRLKRGLLIQFKRYVDQLTGSSGSHLGHIIGQESLFSDFPLNPR